MTNFNTCWSTLIDKFILTHTGQHRMNNFNTCWSTLIDKFILTHTGQHRMTNFNTCWSTLIDKFILTHTGQHRMTNFNLQPPNDTHTHTYIYMSYRTANLQMLHFIYLFNKYTYWIFETCCTLSVFSSSKCRLFHNATFFPCIIHILNTECAKI